MTLPSHPAVLPLRYNDRQSATGSYQDVPDPVLFEMGHGLRYHRMDVVAVESGLDTEQVRLLVTVANRSDAETAGVVTVFGHRRGGVRVPRHRELLAFQRVSLNAGEERQLELLCPRQRAFADPADPTSRTDFDVDGVLLSLTLPGA